MLTNIVYEEIFFTYREIQVALTPQYLHFHACTGLDSILDFMWRPIQVFDLITDDTKKSEG